MAITIKELKLKKVRSERGYRIYRIGNLDCGIVATNYSVGMKWHWEYSLSKLYKSGVAWYTRNPQIKIGFSSIRGGLKEGVFKHDINLILNEKLNTFFKFFFDLT